MRGKLASISVDEAPGSPLLIIQGKRDQTVNPARAEELFRLTVVVEPELLHWIDGLVTLLLLDLSRRKCSAYVCV
ncbi:MAG: hypothetical protein NVSMB33_09510 [Ktedonobacteraceae bacterium]